jgi:hypothetical protein
MMTSVLVVFLCTACAPIPNPPDDEPIVFGAVREITVDVPVGGIIADSGTGLEFVFPDGGKGTLKIEPIIQAPARSLPGGQGCRISVTPIMKIRVRVRIPSSGEFLLYGWMDASGAYSGERPENDWFVLPGTVAGEYVSYELNLGGFKGSWGKKASEPEPEPPIIDTYWSQIIEPPPNAPAIRAQVAKYLAEMTAKLDDGLIAKVLAKERRFPYKVYFRDPDPKLNMKSFYRRYWPFGACIYLNSDSAPEIIAHETAHYLTDLMMTDERWNYLQDHAPQKHAIQDLFTRDTVPIDDYAYFLTLLIGQAPSMLPLAAGPVNSLYFKAGIPSVVDAPSIEGFLTTLLSWFTDVAISPMEKRDFDMVKSEIPLIGMTPGEAARLIAEGAPTIDAFMATLSSEVASRDDERWAGNVMGAVAERIGWSYHGKGKVTVDGMPVVGVQIQAVANVEDWGSRQPYTTPVVLSLAGSYELPRLFPGAQVLQFRYTSAGKVFSKDVELTVDWNKPTSGLLALPDIDLSPDGDQIWPLWIETPRGTFIFYKQQDGWGGGTYTLYRMNPDGTGRISIPGSTRDDWFSAYDVSSLGEIIQFDMTTGRNPVRYGDFVVSDIEGLVLRRFKMFEPTQEGIVNLPRFSPNGTKLVFSGNVYSPPYSSPATGEMYELGQDLWVSDTSGGNMVALTYYYQKPTAENRWKRRMGTCLAGGFDPTGNYVVSLAETFSNLGAMECLLVTNILTRANVTLYGRFLTGEPPFDYHPVGFSPDGAKVYIISNEYNIASGRSGYNIAWTYADGRATGTFTWLTTYGYDEGVGSGFDFSPDGKTIIFTRKDGEGHFRLCTIDAEGGNFRWL